MNIRNLKKIIYCIFVSPGVNTYENDGTTVTYALCNNWHSIASVIFSLGSIREPIPKLVYQDIRSTAGQLPGNSFTGTKAKLK